MIVIKVDHELIRDSSISETLAGLSQGGFWGALNYERQAIRAGTMFLGDLNLERCVKTVLDWLFRIQPRATQSQASYRG